jgi:AraC family transcriptional regulator
MDRSPPLPRTLASGPGWTVQDVVCHARPGERPYEERHDHFVIAIIAQGRFTYHGAAGRHLLHEGAMMLGNAGACYACGHDHSAGDRCLALQFHPDSFAELALAATGMVHYRFPTGKLPVSKHLALLVADVTHALRGRDALPLDEAVTTLAANVVQDVSGADRAISPTLADERRIARVLARMEQDDDAPTDLRSLSQHVHMSRFHFLRVFKAVVGTTPHQHLLHLRLQRATHLLAATRLPVTDVALAAGFNDLSTFNRMFKAWTGKTPRAWRN